MRIPALTLIVLLVACNDAGLAGGSSKAGSPKKPTSPQTTGPGGTGPGDATDSGGKTKPGADGGDAGDGDGGGGSDDSTLGNDADTDGGSKVKFDPSDPTINTEDGQVQAKRCSAPLRVPGTANPFLAGSPAGTQTLQDTAPAQSAPEVVPSSPDCLKPGTKIYFEVSGTITFDPDTPPTTADGRIGDNGGNSPHVDKSGFVAPMNAMVGVFTGATPGSGVADFGTAAAQNRKTYAPKLGEIFFIGDGKTTDGTMQAIIVPDGAQHLYMGVSDRFEWNDNSGELTGAILWRP